MRRLSMGMLALYRKVVSPYLPSQCRFQPTCSNYASQAIDKHGLLKGGWLTVKRLVRCTPFFQGGYDPVP